MVCMPWYVFNCRSDLTFFTVTYPLAFGIGIGAQTANKRKPEWFTEKFVVLATVDLLIEDNCNRNLLTRNLAYITRKSVALRVLNIELGSVVSGIEIEARVWTGQCLNILPENSLCGECTISQLPELQKDVVEQGTRDAMRVSVEVHPHCAVASERRLNFPTKGILGCNEKGTKPIHSRFTSSCHVLANKANLRKNTPLNLKNEYSQTKLCDLCRARNPQKIYEAHLKLVPELSQSIETQQAHLPLSSHSRRSVWCNKSQ